MGPIRQNVMLRRILRAPVCLYHWNLGWLLGHRFLLLIHVGRRTGQRHHAVLEIMLYRAAIPEMVVMSGFGRDANWLRNIEAAQDCEVVVGSRRFRAAYRVLDVVEAVTVIAGYERRHRLIAPIIRAVLGRLVGGHYDGSESARRRIAAALPLVAFRPSL